jgi:hypothetical protein
MFAALAHKVGTWLIMWSAKHDPNTTAHIERVAADGTVLSVEQYG